MSVDATSTYRPYQHTFRPYGSATTLVIANVEIDAENPPPAISLGPWLFDLRAAEQSEKLRNDTE